MIETIDLLLDAGANINARVTNSHTFTAKYVSLTDSFARFKNRRITVIPMP